MDWMQVKEDRAKAISRKQKDKKQHDMFTIKSNKRSHMITELRLRDLTEK